MERVFSVEEIPNPYWPRRRLPALFLHQVEEEQAERGTRLTR
jgi:hypothetical protein